MTVPKKYVRINGVMKLNPEYKRYMEATSGKPATTVKNPNALPIVSSMEDYDIIVEASADTPGGEPEINLAESTAATMEMMKEPEIVLDGLTPDTMMRELGAILNKYEVPIGLMNKLMILSEYEVMEFIIDDSGSMSMRSDTIGATGQPNTRWQEAQQRLKEMLEVVAYVPFNQIKICFLNRKDDIILTRGGRDPLTFLRDAYAQIDAVFARQPSGTTPALERLQESLINGMGRSISRYFFGDGLPNGGLTAQKEITAILLNRQNPQQNPVTFISCTNEDDQVEWMKDAEEVAPYCSESDDFEDEAREVLRDQGAALPYSKGFHLVCQLVAASCPDDLDAMDESVPFTKTTLDNLLGVQHNEASYRHYFNYFVEAQRTRVVDRDAHGKPSKSDQLRKSVDWNSSYQEFLKAPHASHIRAVKAYQAQLKDDMRAENQQNARLLSIN